MYSLERQGEERIVRMMSQMDIPEEIRVKLMESLGVSNQHIDEALR